MCFFGYTIILQLWIECLLFHLDIWNLHDKRWAWTNSRWCLATWEKYVSCWLLHVWKLLHGMKTVFFSLFRLLVFIMWNIIVLLNLPLFMVSGYGNCSARGLSAILVYLFWSTYPKLYDFTACAEYWRRCQWFYTWSISWRVYPHSPWHQGVLAIWLSNLCPIKHAIWFLRTN